MKYTILALAVMAMSPVYATGKAPKGDTTVNNGGAGGKATATSKATATATAKGGTATATGGKGGEGGKGGSVNLTVNPSAPVQSFAPSSTALTTSTSTEFAPSTEYSPTMEHKTEIPRQAVPAFSSAPNPTALCMVGYSAGIGGTIGGLSFGGSIRDKICSLLDTGKTLVDYGTMHKKPALADRGYAMLEAAAKILEDEYMKQDAPTVANAGGTNQ